MKNSRIERTIRLATVFAMLATLLTIGSFASTSPAEAQICNPIYGCDLVPVEPGGYDAVYCVPGYQHELGSCTAYNPGNMLEEQVAWQCPQGPFLVEVRAYSVDTPYGQIVEWCAYNPFDTPAIPPAIIPRPLPFYFGF